MRRTITLGLGVAVVVLAVWLVAKGFKPPQPLNPPALEAGAAADAAVESGALALDDAGVFLSDFSPTPEPRLDAGVFGRLPDGRPIPPLSPDAPKTIRFGVVLVGYAGAQPGPVGDKPNPRDRGDAKALADKLAAEAVTDFHAAVQRGDPGSADDVGRIHVGFLEPLTDYMLFSLKVDEVSVAFDTPRGYWIAKRLE
jgi:hypothetical protein